MAAAQWLWDGYTVFQPQSPFAHFPSARNTHAFLQPREEILELNKRIKILTEEKNQAIDELQDPSTRWSKLQSMIQEKINDIKSEVQSLKYNNKTHQIPCNIQNKEPNIPIEEMLPQLKL